MAKQLKLEVLLAAVDKVTRPLKAMNETAGKVSADFRQTKARLNDLNKQAGMIDGYRKSNSALQETSAKLENAREKASRLAREFKATQNPTKAMKRELDNARSSMKSLDSSKTKLTRTVQEQRQKLEQNGVSTKNLSAARSKLRNETKRLNSELALQKDRLSAVTKQQERLNKVSKNYQHVKELQGKLAGTGAQMTATGGGAVALMGAPAIMSERQGAAIAAQMGQSELSSEYQLVIKEVYESGAGDGIAGISEAISAVSSSLGSLKNTSQASVVEMTRQALTLSRAYGIDVSSATQTAALLVKNGLAKSANEAFDLMTSGMQNVSKEMRDELPDIIQEYGTNFRALGFSGEQAFNMLVAQAENGKYALDKTGDALKEFTIRGSDMSKASTEAYEALGMNAFRASAAVAAGGSEARAVLNQTAERLLAIENPARRANLAISLFGTPLEDLSVDQIPSFLKGLGNMENKLGDTSGSTLKLDSALRNNTGDALIQVQRIISGSFMTIIKDLSDDIVSLSKSFSAWAKENPELLATIAKVSAVVAGLVAVGGALTLTIAGLLGPIAAVRMAFSILHIKTFPGVTVAAKAASGALLSTGKSALIAAKSTGAKAWGLLTGKIKAATAATISYRKSNGLLATVMAGSKAALLGVGKAITGAVLAPLKFLKLAIMGVTKALIMNPIGAIIAGIAAAGLLIYKFWEPIKAFFIGMWQGIKEAFAPVGELITDIFSEVGQVLAPLKPLWDGIASVLGTVWGWISQLFKPFQATSEQLEGATNAGRSFGKVFASVFLFIPKLVLGAVKMVIGIFKKIPGAISAVWDGLKKIFWWSPIGLIIKAFSKAFDWLTSIDWSGIVSGAWETIKTIFKWSPLGLIVRGFSAAFNWITNIDWAGYASSAWDSIKSVFNWSPLAAIRDRFNGAINWLTNINWAGSAASAWQSIKSVFSWSPLAAIRDRFNGAINWLTNIDWAGYASAPWEKVKQVFSWSPLAAIRERFNGAIDWLTNIDWSGSAASAWESIKSVFNWPPLASIRERFNGAINWLTNIDWAGSAASAWESIKSVFNWSPLASIRDRFNGAINWIANINWAGSAASAWESIKSVFSWSPLAAIRDRFNGAINWLTNIDWAGYASAPWEKVKQVFSWSPLAAIRERFNGAIDWLTNIDWSGSAASAWESIKSVFNWPPLASIRERFNGAINWLTNIDWAGSAASAWESIKSVFSWSPLASIRDRFNGAINWIANINWAGSAASTWENIKSVFSWSPLAAIRDRFNGAINWLTNINWAGSAASAWESIKSVFSWSPLAAIRERFNGAIDWITNIDWAGSAASTWESIKSVFSWSPLASIRERFNDAINWLANIDWAGSAASTWESIKSVFSWSPLETIKNGFNAVLEFLGGLPAKFSELGSNILSGLVDGITGALGKVKDGIVEAASSVSSWFKETLGINSPSKVFMLHGDDTMRGLALGLRGNDEPVKEVNRTSGQLKKAAAGMAITAAISMPVAAEQPADLVRNIKYQEESLNLPGIQDTVQRIQTREIERTTEAQQVTQLSERPVTVESNLNISEGAIVIQAGAGADPKEIAQQVRQELQRLERERAAENRSKLRDLD